MVWRLYGLVLLVRPGARPIPGAHDLALWDGALVLVAAFCCCRGWSRDELSPRARVPHP